MSILCAVSYTDFSSILPSLLANVDSEAEMKGTEASHHKLSNGSSSINLNITSSPIEGDDDGPSAQKPMAVSEDQSCKAVLERVNFLDNPSKEELASCFTDVMTQIAQDVAYDVRGSPFSHNKIGQYFYLVATGCGFALSILFIFVDASPV
ncbi:hypothetical protein IGI04_039914 [Brassica rapa subsp. trilocularis]|uniref:Uncharacterized protein n=1 Tax=Brassica rapa subsp. trilocularis TaxID=1813537 RepID=A0ABQ7KM67_BRACM|nr:hypothetical protein IGI04_039914 [Brassica rapa subsp. trilocularis]